MMDEEIRQAVSEVREMKQMCGNINMKLTDIVTQRGQDWKKKLETEYQRGLDDAWECARKIADMWTRIDNDELLAIFGITERIGHSAIKSLFGKQTANEAMLELEAYEEKQKADDEIKVGDEVIYNGTTKCIVVRQEDDKRYASLIDSDGTHYSADHRECKKTGRHFDIPKILAEMKA